MIAIKGIYDGESIQPLEEVPNYKQCRVLITFLDEEDFSLEDELTPEQYSRLQESLKQTENGETVLNEIVMSKAKSWIGK